jgi:hypothetical protein
MEEKLKEMVQFGDKGITYFLNQKIKVMIKN